MNKKERVELICQVSKASGVAQYAFEDALKRSTMTDEELIELGKHLETCCLLKPAVMRNRAQQKSYTQNANQKAKQIDQELQEANRKLQEFMNLQNSEILQAGRWLLNALSRGGEERKQALSERELVHQSDHRMVVDDMGEAIVEMKTVSTQNKDEYAHIVKTLEGKIDDLKSNLQAVKEKVIQRQGILEWQKIERELKKFQVGVVSGKEK
jgi:hypothetical protein